MIKKYKIYIDENMPGQLAKGLNTLQQPQNSKENVEIEVFSIKEVFGGGAQDEDWIPKVGAENGIVITQDFRIQSQKHQRELYLQNGVGIIFLSQSKVGLSYWEMVKKIINEWDDIKRIIRREKPPFAYRGTPKTKFEKLVL